MCEMPDVINTVDRKANKNHNCYECGSLIVKGEKYSFVKGIWDSVPSEFKICFLCVGVFNEVNSYPGVECIGFGELYESVSEYGLWHAVRDMVPHRVLMRMHNDELDAMCEQLEESPERPLPCYDAPWIEKRLRVSRQIHQDGQVYQYTRADGSGFGWLGA